VLLDPIVNVQIIESGWPIYAISHGNGDHVSSGTRSTIEYALKYVIEGLCVGVMVVCKGVHVVVKITYRHTTCYLSGHVRNICFYH
jgi:hypothetical protein